MIVNKNVIIVTIIIQFRSTVADSIGKSELGWS